MLEKSLEIFIHSPCPSSSLIKPLPLPFLLFPPLSLAPSPQHHLFPSLLRLLISSRDPWKLNLSPPWVQLAGRKSQNGSNLICLEAGKTKFKIEASFQEAIIIMSYLYMSLYSSQYIVMFITSFDLYYHSWKKLCSYQLPTIKTKQSKADE